MSQQVGPSIKLEVSCFECVHCESISYTCQGDSGSNVFCKASDGRRVGDSCWRTPDWCPLRAEAIVAFFSSLPAPREARDATQTAAAGAEENTQKS